MRNARRNSAKLLASLALVAGAAGVAGLGTYGSFTSTTSASTDVGSGIVKLDLANQAARGLNVAVSSMVPGDYAQRAVTLTRATDSEAFASVGLTTAAGQDNLLGTGGAGLVLSIDACSAAWVKDTVTDDLTCPGTTTGVLAAGPITRTATLNNVTAPLNGAGRVASLRIQLSLPVAADNRYQNLTNTVGFSFVATQRAGMAR